MDAVILAAGYGERLHGVVPRFWKPMMLVQGEPVVSRAVRQALDADCNRVIVVVSPQNAAPMSEILPQSSNVHMVVQRNPYGPGDALLRGLEIARDRSTLVLMGDNVSSDDDVTRIAEMGFIRPDGVFFGGVGIRVLDPTEETMRFTRRRMVNGQQRWVEKEPFTDNDISADKKIRAWVGPLILERSVAVNVLTDLRAESRPEIDGIPIGPYLDRLIPRLHVVQVGTVDVGTPEVAREVTTT